MPHPLSLYHVWQASASRMSWPGRAGGPGATLVLATLHLSSLASSSGTMQSPRPPGWGSSGAVVLGGPRKAQSRPWMTALCVAVQRQNQSRLQSHLQGLWDRNTYFSLVSSVNKRVGRELRLFLLRWRKCSLFRYKKAESEIEEIRLLFKYKFLKLSRCLKVQSTAVILLASRCMVLSWINPSKSWLGKSVMKLCPKFNIPNLSSFVKAPFWMIHIRFFLRFRSYRASRSFRESLPMASMWLPSRDSLVRLERFLKACGTYRMLLEAKSSLSKEGKCENKSGWISKILQWDKSRLMRFNNPLKVFECR